MNLIINLDHDEWILDDHSKTLEQIGAREWLLAAGGIGAPPDKPFSAGLLAFCAVY